jgi:hypothetical protein
MTQEHKLATWDGLLASCKALHRLALDESAHIACCIECGVSLPTDGHSHDCPVEQAEIWINKAEGKIP